MMLIFSAFVASLDGLLIGLSLRLSHQKLTYFNIFILFSGNIFLYSTLLSIYFLFHFQFVTKFISTIFYIFLAYNSFSQKNKETLPETTCLNFSSCLFLTLVHSIDGALVSLGFVYEYPIFLIIFLFSFMAVLLMVIGNYGGSFFQNIKKSNYYGAFLFLLLAIFNQFFS